jgi:hypothetical protein
MFASSQFLLFYGWTTMPQAAGRDKARTLRTKPGGGDELTRARSRPARYFTFG